MYQYYQKENRRRNLTVIPEKKAKPFHYRQKTSISERPNFQDTYIHYTAVPLGGGPESKRTADAADLSTGTECIQAKWKPSTAFAARVSVNGTASIRTHFESIAAKPSISKEDKETLENLLEKLKDISEPTPAVYMWDSHELYINGRLIPLSDVVIELLENRIQRDLDAITEQSTDTTTSSDNPDAFYPRLDADMDYLRQINKSLDFFEGTAPDMEVSFDEAGTARQILKDELARVWRNVCYKNSFLTGEQQGRPVHGNDRTEQTRANLIEKSLMVLPEGLPLAGLFPDEDKVEILDEDKDRYKDKYRAYKFARLNEHAVSLIKKYHLHFKDGGIIMLNAGCVCIMYYKERGEGKSIYKPAFGISGYFRGKKDGVKTGFQAMGIPEDLLKAENKLEALKIYLWWCDFLKIRKPSIQACLSYLQKAPEYNNIERWEPIICAEPEIVMAVHNLYGQATAVELVLSFPFQGSLAQKPGSASHDADNQEPDTEIPDSTAAKEPVPKYTCARCALAEKSFGATIQTGNGIGRRQVRMSVKHDISEELFKPDLIRNPDKRPFESDGLAYMDLIRQNGSTEVVPKRTLYSFLEYSRANGIFHGRQKHNPGTVPAPPKVLPQVLSGNYIRDEHGDPVNYIDVPGTRNNCFFYALWTATGIPLDIDHIRENLRRALQNPNLFQENAMVDDDDLNALRQLSNDDFQRLLGTPGFTVQIYGNTGLFQSTDYGNVGAGTPVLINIGYNHFVVKQ